MRPPHYDLDQLSLRPYELKDEDRFVEMALDKVSVRFMGGSRGDEAEERTLFQKIFQLYEKDSERWFWVYGIYRGELLCGHLELKETKHTEKGELEVVYMIHPQERRKGIMAQVLNFVKGMQKAWDRKIIATVSPQNKNSLRLLENWGITQQETLLDEDGKTYLKVWLS